MTQYTEQQLLSMKKTELYSIAKSIDNTIPYSTSTKKKLAECIMNNCTNIQNLPEPASSLQKPARNQPIIGSYANDYIENLKEQVEFFKKQSNYWRDLYINLLKESMNKPIPSVTQPNTNEMIKKMTKLVNHNENNNIKKENVIVKKPVKKTPWDKVDKPNNDDKKMSTGDYIKHCSTIDYVNEMTQKDIADMGFKSREDFLKNQLAKLKKTKSIFGELKQKKVKLKKITN